MIASLPTADEIATVVGSGLGETELEKPEQWVLSCARLPQLHTRLDCWAFKLQVGRAPADHCGGRYFSVFCRFFELHEIFVPRARAFTLVLHKWLFSLRQLHVVDD